MTEYFLSFQSLRQAYKYSKDDLIPKFQEGQNSGIYQLVSQYIFHLPGTAISRQLAGRSKMLALSVLTGNDIRLRFPLIRHMDQLSVSGF